MRDIKFRAWDEVSKTMKYHTWRDAESQVHDMWQFVVALTDDCQLLQYTGLNDKNGEDIYEGDIVRRWNMDDYDDDTDTIKLAPTEQISFVEYRGHGFWIECEGFGWEGEGLWPWDQLEVIGNIYENPELLNSEPNVQVSDTTAAEQRTEDDHQNSCI